MKIELKIIKTVEGYTLIEFYGKEFNEIISKPTLEEIEALLADEKYYTEDYGRVF
jgi:hypothetical protein